MADDPADAAAETAVDTEEDDIFGPAEADESAPQRSSTHQSPVSILTKIRLTLREWLSRSPKALEWAQDTEAVAIGLQSG